MSLQNGESEASLAGTLAKESQLTKVGSYYISMYIHTCCVTLNI